MTTTIDNNTIDAEDLIEVHVPRHTVGADIRLRRAAGIAGPPFVSVWCSCGWKGDTISIQVTGGRFDPFTDVPTEVIEEAARSWRFHVRLSNRVHRTDKRLRRQAAKAREEQQ